MNLEYLNCISLKLIASSNSSLFDEFISGILFVCLIQFEIYLIFFKSLSSVSKLFRKLTFKVLLTRSITNGILSLLSSPIALIHLPNCCKNNILESSFNVLNQIIPSICSTWTPSFNISITNINFFLVDFDELKSDNALVFCFFELSESILYVSISFFNFLCNVDAILESARTSQFIYSIILLDMSFESV